MLRAVQVPQLNRFVQSVHQNKYTLPFKGGSGDIPLGQHLQLLCDLFDDSSKHRLGSRDEHRRCQRIVLSLGQQVSCRKDRVGGFVCNDQGLRGSVQTIHRDLTVDHLLG